MSNPENKYQVDHRLLMDDEQYEAGDLISLTIKDAGPLLNTNPPVISLPGKSENKSTGKNTNAELEDRISAIKIEVGKLDKDDETKWTAAGLPDATVLTEMLGWKVKAGERNQAWMEMLAEGSQA